MKNILRFYNKNKESIWISIFIIVLIVVVVHTINGFVKSKNKSQSGQTVATQNTTTTNIYTEQAKQSRISDTKVSDTEYKKESGLIDNFIGYCNSKKVEEAYNLLTDECKENLFPTIEDFNNNYINRTFSSYKTYTIQNYTRNTYVVRLTEDMLSTGIANNGTALQDYYTIVDDKLNINEYIGREKIENFGETNNIRITVLYKDIFMDYEKYTVEVYNGSDKTIKLDSQESTKSIYLVNSNNIQFNSYSHELIEALLEIPQGNTRQIQIKFYNNYVTTNEIKKIVFSDIILDYDEYKNFVNQSLYDNRGKCEVQL